MVKGAQSGDGSLGLSSVTWEGTTIVRARRFGPFQSAGC